MSAWRWWHLLLLWTGVLITACLLTWWDFARRGNFAYLIPYPAGVRGTWRFIRLLFVTFPFAAMGWIALPSIALVLTLWWLVLRHGH